MILISRFIDDPQVILDFVTTTAKVSLMAALPGLNPHAYSILGLDRTKVTRPRYGDMHSTHSPHERKLRNLLLVFFGSESFLASVKCSRMSPKKAFFANDDAGRPD